VNTLTISGNVDEGSLRVTPEFIAHSRDLDSAVNTSSASWTLTDTPLIRFNDLTVRLRPVDEYTITSSNDVLQMVEDTAGTPDDVNIDVPDGTYSGEQLAQKMQDLLNAGTSNSIVYEVKYDYPTKKFSFRNTNNALLIQIDVSDSDIDPTIGFTADPTAALLLTSQVGGQFDNADLDSADEISINNFSIVLNNNLSDNDQTTGTGDTIEEPIRNGKYDLTMTIR
jgi:hypothetical protein